VEDECIDSYWAGFRRARLTICEHVRKQVQGAVTLVAGIWILLSAVIAGWYGPESRLAYIIAGAGAALSLIGIMYVSFTVTKASVEAEQNEIEKSRQSPRYK